MGSCQNSIKYFQGREFPGPGAHHSNQAFFQNDHLIAMKQTRGITLALNLEGRKNKREGVAIFREK